MENIAHKHYEKLFNKTDPEITQMTKLVDHAFTSSIIKILKNLKGKQRVKKENMNNKEMKTIKKKEY